MIRVYRDHMGDWTAECEQHATRTFCGDWEAALEAAYGHAAMSHRPSCDHEYGWYPVGRPEEHKCLTCGEPLTQDRDGETV